MRKVAAGKGRAGPQRGLGGAVGRGGKGLNPAVVHQHEVEHRREQFGIVRPRPKLE